MKGIRAVYASDGKLSGNVFPDEGSIEPRSNLLAAAFTANVL